MLRNTWRGVTTIISIIMTPVPVSPVKLIQTLFKPSKPSLAVPQSSSSLRHNLRHLATPPEAPLASNWKLIPPKIDHAAIFLCSLLNIVLDAGTGIPVREHSQARFPSLLSRGKDC